MPVEVREYRQLIHHIILQSKKIFLQSNYYKYKLMTHKLLIYSIVFRFFIDFMVTVQNGHFINCNDYNI